MATPDSFDKIGLALSGGGVRAVGFHLGTLDILERVKRDDGKNLLGQVTMLSAVSGGSLVALGYALSLKTEGASSGMSTLGRPSLGQRPCSPTCRAIRTALRSRTGA